MTKDKSAARIFGMLVVALVVGCLGFAYWLNETVWPVFPQAGQSALAPQAVLRIERDYGWRSGDLVPVELFIKQQRGTTVDLDNLAVIGDFEIHDHPGAASVRMQADGSKLIRLRFKAQTLNYGETRSLALAMSYRIVATGEVDNANVEPAIVHISKTYDGRPDIQLGPLAMVFSAWDLFSDVLFIAVAIAMVFGAFYLWRLDAVLNKPAQDFADALKDSFLSVWQKIASGDVSPQNYEELERIIRRMFGLEPQTRGQIELMVVAAKHPFQDEIIAIISLCDKRLYDHQQLSEDEHKSVKAAFDQILSGRPKRRPTLPPRPAKVEAPGDGNQNPATTVSLNETEGQEKQKTAEALTEPGAQGDKQPEPADAQAASQASGTDQQTIKVDVAQAAEGDKTAPAETVTASSHQIEPTDAAGKDILRGLQKGTVKWFNATRGCGFITPESGSSDVFVQMSELKRAGISSLRNGDIVEYELGDYQGKVVATKLVVYRPEPVKGPREPQRHRSGRGFLALAWIGLYMLVSTWSTSIIWHGFCILTLLTVFTYLFFPRKGKDVKRKDDDTDAQ
jgi:CspA family cold shock protein